MNKIISRVALYVVIILLVLGIVQYISSQGEESKVITFDSFLTAFKDNKVQNLTLKVEGLTYLVKGELSEKNKKVPFVTTAPFDSSVVKMVTESKIKQTWQKQEGPSIWVTLLTSIIPFIIIFFLFFFLLNQSQGGGGKVMNFGKSRARLYNDDKKRVTFEDVAGADEEKQELVELVDFLKDPRKFATLGARIPKGVLLVGPPGTGKTLLARAVAGEAGVPFFTISGSDFVEMFVGVGASRVRDLFENAKKNAPCIIFIDEIDAVGRQRGAGLGGGHDEREQTLNQLLVEMDGFGANEGIIIIAATNRPDILDPALLRPGRFDRQITVDRPDIKGREAVLKVHARNKQLNEDVKLDSLARYTIGFTGADLENLLNEAALIAARRDRKDISMDEIEEAFDRIAVGTQKKTRVISEREKRTVAYHEAGHAVIGHYIENAEEVHRVTIVPRGRAGGYVMMFPKNAEDPLITTKTELFDRVTGLLGGRLAEEIFIGEISSGAFSDFKKATAIVRSMIVDYGMSDKLGPMQFGTSQGQVFLGRDIGHEQNYSEAIAYEIDKEMQNFIRTCYERGRDVLKEHEDKVHLVAKTLIEKETLEKEEIRHLLEHGTLPPKSGSRNSNGSNGDSGESGAGTESSDAANGEKPSDVKVTIQENERDSNALELDKDKDKDKDNK